MSIALATRPTARDEDWRYADSAALDAMADAAFEQVKEVVVAPGETRSHAMMLDHRWPGLHRVRIDVAAGARAEMFAVLSADSYTRLDIEVRLGAGAHFEFGAVTIGGGKVTREVVTRVTHAEPDASSRQVVRAVHWDTATGNFLGRVAVARNAQHTDAAQDFKGLLLSRGASANAKPELEIFADDVKCAHGAAIGQLDETARFYMAARGIPPELADQLLVRAFIADALVSAGDEQDSMLAGALAALETRA